MTPTQSWYIHTVAPESYQAGRTFLLVTAVLSAVAALAPAPWWATDRHVYERMSREWFIPGCNDFHCFRPFVSIVLGFLPGTALIKWKAYAVVCEAGAAILMGLPAEPLRHLPARPALR